MHNLTAISPAKPDKYALQNVGVSPPASGWALSDRLDWAMGLQVSPPARFVAVAIVKHTGTKTLLAWPSMATLAGLTGYSKATVKRAVRELDKGSHFTVARLKVGRLNTSNRYRPQNVSGPHGWGQSDPRGGVRATPEPVSTEPVHTQRARVSCETHGRSWYEADGVNCFECAQERMKDKRSPRKPRGGMPTYRERPLRPVSPMTDEQKAAAEHRAIADGWRKVGGKWTRVR